MGVDDLAFNIRFDYTYDTTGFFDDPDRRAALGAAASIWESIILDEFQNVAAGVSFSITNPSNSAEEVTVTLDQEIDDLLVFVGAEDLGGWYTGTDGLQYIRLGDATREGYDAAGDVLTSRIWDSFRAVPTTDFEPFAGTITFNTNAAVNWHFGADDPTAGLHDFFTTVFHEIGHNLGFGSSGPYANLVTTEGFVGPNALAVNNGSPIPISGSHIESGFAGDTTLMDPSRVSGTRVYPTVYDLAILADIGYQIDGFVAQGQPHQIVTEGNDVTVYGTIVDDVLDALGGSDRIQGNLGNDHLIGNAGDDVIFGGGGNDLLEGGADDDYLAGGDDSDTLDGGTGRDYLVGGAGADVFRFLGGSGTDTIDDFEFSIDRIQIGASYGFASVAEVLATVTRPFSNAAQLDLGGGNYVIIHDDAAGSVLTAANIFIGDADIVREGRESTTGLDLGAWRNGAIDAEPIPGDGETPDNTGPGNFIDKDWYRVTLDPDTTYQFDAQSLSLSTGIVFARLYDSAGLPVGAAQEGEGVAPSFTFSTAGQTEPQTYYLAVSAGDYGEASEPFRTAIGGYRVRYQDVTAIVPDFVPGDISTNEVLTVGGSRTSEIDQSDLSGDTVDADYYQVTLEGGRRYTFWADAGVDTTDSLSDVFIRLRGADGRILTPDISDDGATPAFVFDAPGTGAQTYYLAISAGGGGAWWDATGQYSVNLIDDGLAPATNYVPWVAGIDRSLLPGAEIALADLFDIGDLNGLSDIVSFAVQDRTAGGGHIVYDGLDMGSNHIWTDSFDNIDKWKFIVGDGSTDLVGLSVTDGASATSGTEIAVVEGWPELLPPSTPETLFPEGKLATLGHFALASYWKDASHEVANLRDAGWTILDANAAAARGWTFVGDAGFEGNYFKNGNASALLAESGNGKTLVIAFTGTDGEWADRIDWVSMWDHYGKFSDLIAYLDAATYDNIYVTGHSLGAAMAEAFKTERSTDPNVEAIVFANPGFGVLNQDPVNGMVNIRIQGDAIALPDLAKEIAGDEYTISHWNLSSPVELHRKELYFEVAKYLQSSSYSYDILGDSFNGTKDHDIIGVKITDDGRVLSPDGVTVGLDGTLDGGTAAAGGGGGGSWSYSYEPDLPGGSITVSADAAIRTAWSVSAQGPLVKVADLVADNPVFWFQKAGEVVFQAKEAALTLIVEPLAGTEILQNTVYFRGGLGDDEVDGSDADRRIVATGGDGADILIGGFPDDDLDGGIGNDTLTGGRGNDSLTGGPGDDVFRASALQGDDVITDFEIGADAANGDKIDVTGLGIDYGDITFTAAAAGLRVGLATGSFTLAGESAPSLVATSFLGLGTTGANTAPELTIPASVNVAAHQIAVTTLTATDAEGNLPSFAIAGGDDADLFQVDPATGALAFRAAPFFAAPRDANGDNIYDLLLAVSDGIDVSAPQAFSIQVLPGVYTEIFGTGFDDSGLVGTVAADHIIGMAGDDAMNGKSGNDWLEGGDGNDKLYGSNSDDLLQGGAGDDYLAGINGADILDGGPGTDMASWKFSPVPVTVNLALGTVSGGTGDGDVLISIENLEGSRDHGDTLTGDAGPNRVYARGGDDSVSGGLGADRLYGEAGDDTLNGGGDNDVLLGGIGADSLDGGAGAEDWAGYYQSAAAVTVDLSLAGPQVSDGEASGDVLTNIENLQGSNYNDVLTGHEGANRFYGLNGHDTLNGAAGDDKLYGGAGNDTINGGADNDLLAGGADGDTLDGGDGVDTAYYASSAGAVQVDLAAGTGAGGDATGDSLANIENVAGSRFDDVLSGDTGANRLTGNGGADTLNGGAGNDKIYGGTGTDRLNGGADNDYLVGGIEADTFAFGTNWGRDVIGDYQQGIDILDMSATGLTAAEVTIVDGGNGHTLVIDTLTGLNRIRLDNTDWTTISTADLFFGP